MISAAAEKCLIIKGDMHIYTYKGQSTVQLEPAQTRMRTWIQKYMMSLTTTGKNASNQFHMRKFVVYRLRRQ